MNSIIFILTVVVIVGFLLCPSFIIWWFAYLWMPANYKLPPYKMTLLCLLLSFLTGMALNFELESGAASGGVAILVLSLCWTLIMIPAVTVIRYILNRSRSHGAT